MAEKDYGVATIVNDVDERADAILIDGNANHGTEGQGFERYINFAAIINFGVCLQSAWEGAGLFMGSAFLNGGPVSLVYGSILSAFGNLAITFSLAEMASIDPHVGAQYRWSALFAQSWQEFWGLLQGWITVFAWTTAVTSVLVSPASIIQGIVMFWNPSYTAPTWHTTLIMWALLACAIFCNLFLRRVLNVLETLGAIFHLAAWVTIIAVLTTFGKRSTTEFVFTKLVSDVSGWNNPGICFNLGLLPVLLPLSGPDSILHMIDETKLPRERVPVAMIVAVASNAIMMFGYILAVLFYIGDYDTVSQAPVPILEVYYQATNSKTAATVLVVMQMSMTLIALFNCLASVSRLIWAFAKDKGLPYSNFFTKIHPKLQIPIPALGLVVVVNFALSLINIGSSVAFNAIISLTTMALYLSYVIPLYHMLVRKVQGRPPRYGPFQLGRWGIPVNLFALLFVLYSISWVSLPVFYPVAAETMNFAGPITIVVLILALIDWCTSGKRRFKIPIAQHDIDRLEGRDRKGSST